MNVILKNFKRRKKLQKGNMLFGVAAAILIGLYLTAQVGRQVLDVNGSTKEQAFLDHLIKLQLAITKLYEPLPNYAGLNNASLISAGLVDPKYVNGAAGITHPFNNSITVAPVGASSNYYSITINGIPQEACKSIAVLDFGRSMRQMNVGGGVTSSATYTQAQANAECSGADETTIYWEFF